MGSMGSVGLGFLLTFPKYRVIENSKKSTNPVTFIISKKVNISNVFGYEQNLQITSCSYCSLQHFSQFGFLRDTAFVGNQTISFKHSNNHSICTLSCTFKQVLEECDFTSSSLPQDISFAILADDYLVVQVSQINIEGHVGEIEDEEQLQQGG